MLGCKKAARYTVDDELDELPEAALPEAVLGALLEDSLQVCWEGRAKSSKTPSLLFPTSTAITS